MEFGNLLVLVLICVTLLAVILLGAILLHLYSLSQKGEELKETPDDIERRMISEDSKRPKKVDRIHLERRLEAQLEELNEANKSLELHQKEVVQDYEQRFFQHVHVDGQDPVTFGMPPKMQEMKRQIKELEKRVAEKEAERKAARKAAAEEDKKNAREKQKNYYSYVDNLFGEGSGLRPKDVELTEEEEEVLKHFPSRGEQLQAETEKLREQLKEQRRINRFHEIDEDSSGYIEKHELERRVQAVIGRSDVESEVESLLASMDANGDGVVDRDEFVSYCSSTKGRDEMWWDVGNTAGPTPAPPDERHVGPLQPKCSKASTHRIQPKPRQQTGVSISHPAVRNFIMNPPRRSPPERLLSPAEV